MSQRPDEKELLKAMGVAEEWFGQLAEVNPNAHRELKKMLRDAVPVAKDLDYFLDVDARRVEIIIYVSTWTTMTRNLKKISESVLEVMQACLNDFTISVSVKRYSASTRAKRPALPPPSEQA